MRILLLLSLTLSLLTAASMATTTPVRGSSPPVLGITISLHHFSLLLLLLLLLVAVDVVAVVSAPPVNAAALVSL